MVFELELSWDTSLAEDVFFLGEFAKMTLSKGAGVIHNPPVFYVLKLLIYPVV